MLSASPPLSFPQQVTEGWDAEHSSPRLTLTPSPHLGCVAYRDEKGSDFVQTLVEVIRANPGGDLLELLTEV